MTVLERHTWFGFDFASAEDFEPFLDGLFGQPQNGQTTLPLLITPNVDQVIKYQRAEHQELFNTFKNARYILPDGQPIVAVSKLFGQDSSLKRRLTGSDFFPAFWKALKDSGKSALMVVPNEQTASLLEQENPRVQCYVPPYYDRSVPGEEENVIRSCLHRIRMQNPDYMVIGLGFPKQEYLAQALFERLEEAGERPPFMLLLGASFEFYLGIKQRAPMVFRKLGLEFLHRLLSEPRRLFKRYLVDGWAFFPLAWKELRKKRR